MSEKSFFFFFFAVNLPLKLYRVTVVNADFGVQSLSIGLHSFKNVLYHMLVFEQNRMVQSTGGTPLNRLSTGKRTNIVLRDRNSTPNNILEGF